jgi:hypothetical protein
VTAVYHINTDDEFISFSFADEVNLIDFYELLQDLLNDPGFQPAWPQLMDLRNIDLDLKPGALKPFVKYLAATYSPRVDGVVAVVLDSKMSADFYAGVYRLACSLPGTEVFDDYGQAIKWLLQQGWKNSASEPADTSPGVSSGVSV